MSPPRTVVTFLSGAALVLASGTSHGAEPGNCFSEKNDLLVADRDAVGLSKELRSLAQGDEKRFAAFSKAIVDSYKGPGGEEYSDDDTFSRWVIHPRGGAPEVELLALHFPASWQYRYAFFFKKDEQWTLGDKVIEVESRSGSEPTLAEDNGALYISLSRKGGGTGGYGSTGDVYGLNAGKVVRVLSDHPIEGQYALPAEAFGIEYSSRLCFESAKDAKGPLALSLDVRVLAENGSGDPDAEKGLVLFEKRLGFTYGWDPGRKAYVVVDGPGRAGAAPSKVLIEQYTRGSGLIVSSFEELRAIAAGKDEAKRRWLRGFLDDGRLGQGKARAKRDALRSLLQQ